MNSRRTLAAAVLALSLVCLACGGGGGGSSPTEPTPPPATGKRFQFNVVAGAAILQGALLEATVSVDGREVSRMDWSRTGSSCAVLCTLTGDVSGLSPGTHTITFTVVRQTRTTVDYLVGCSGILIDPGSGNREPLNFPLQRAELRAGQSVTFNVRI